MENNQNDAEIAAQRATAAGPIKQMDISAYLQIILLKYALYVTSPKFLLIFGCAVSVAIMTEGFLCFTFCDGLCYIKKFLIIN